MEFRKTVRKKKNMTKPMLQDYSTLWQFQSRIKQPAELEEKIVKKDS